MDKLELRLLNASLFTYVSLVIMNSIRFIGGVGSLGSVGKFGFCLIFIGFFLVGITRSRIRFKLLNKPIYLSILVCLLLFTVLFILRTETRINMLTNVAFPVYFVFYYLLIRLYIRAFINRGSDYVLENVKLQLFKTINQALTVHFFLWYALAFALGARMHEIDGSYGGFFQDQIHFGLYMVTGFLVNLYLRFNEFKPDKSRFNLIMLGIYGVSLLYTSRNAVLIVVVVVAYFFIISRIRNWVYSALLVLTPLVLAGVNLFVQGLSIKRLNEITSGRFQIWTYVIEKINETSSWVIGNGLFNLNDIILKENVGKGSLYMDSLRSLSLHSSYIEILAGGGVLVLGVFLWAVLRVVKRTGRLEKSIVLGIMIGAFFESYLVQPFMLISLIFYLILFSHSLKVYVGHSMARYNLEKVKDLLDPELNTNTVQTP